MSAATGAAAPQAGPAPGTDDLTLVVDGRRFGGWTDLALTRGLEIMPASFDIALTELYPGQADAIDIQPGAAVQVLIGDDVVLTGYVNRYLCRVGPDGHEVRVMGRGRCQDLVDCSAGIGRDGNTRAMSINGRTALGIAQLLAAPFEIEVVEQGVENDLPILAFQLVFGESAYSVIDRIGRYRGLLAYEDAQGQLVLGAVGADSHASGFALPGNVTSAQATRSDDERHSVYLVSRTSTDTLVQVAPGGTVAAVVADDTPPTQRFRPLAFVSEQIAPDHDVATLRAAWEMNRRNGRARSVTLTCDSWRDGEGRIWEPNRLAPVDMPSCKVARETLLIGQVTYRRGREGTFADLVLMPPGAFAPQPGALSGLGYQLDQALGGTPRGGADPTLPAAGYVPGPGAADLPSTGTAIG